MPKYSDYTKIKRLGKGAYGEAWSVQKRGETRLSCLKSVDMSDLEPEEKERQRNESVNLSKVHSSYVIQLYSSFEEGDNLYIETELCEGGSLENVVNVFPLSFYLLILFFVFYF